MTGCVAPCKPIERMDTQHVSMSLSGQSEPAAPVPVIDYEGSGYRTDFWEGQGRNYEDAAERLAISRLLPPQGGRIAEIGAGFGRLADMYAGYRQVILFDYSRTLLQEAVARWGHDPRFVFVAGNIYQLSLAKASLDALVMVRVMHHLADVPAALTHLRRVLRPDGVAVLEYANKRNLKAMGRWLLRRQTWSPLEREPVEFVKLNFDFHPQWMQARMDEAALRVEDTLAVSHFRTGLLKRTVAPERLAKLDSLLFGLGGRFPVAPSVFLKVRPEPSAVSNATTTDRDTNLTDLFACPACRGERTFDRVDDVRLTCRTCGNQVVQRDGIWDFKEPA